MHGCTKMSIRLTLLISVIKSPFRNKKINNAVDKCGTLFTAADIPSKPGYIGGQYIMR